MIAIEIALKDHLRTQRETAPKINELGNVMLQ